MTVISADRPSSNPQSDLLGDFLDGFAACLMKESSP